MSGWQAGDLAVCVDASDRNGFGPSGHLLSEGRVYRVVRIVPTRAWRSGGNEPGLLIDGPRTGNPDGDWHPERFRKIRPDAHEGNIEDWRDLVEFFTKRVNA